MEGRSKLKNLLQGLKSDNESQQLESLMELCDHLSMGTEESLAGFSIDSFVPAIVNLLNMEHNPDMMHIRMISFNFRNYFDLINCWHAELCLTCSRRYLHLALQLFLVEPCHRCAANSYP